MTDSKDSEGVLSTESLEWALVQIVENTVKSSDPDRFTKAFLDMKSALRESLSRGGGAAPLYRTNARMFVNKNRPHSTDSTRLHVGDIWYCPADEPHTYDVSVWNGQGWHLIS